jgi:hypothetical protein
MNLTRQLGFRQKLDVLAWRTQRRLAYLIAENPQAVSDDAALLLASVAFRCLE